MGIFSNKMLLGLAGGAAALSLVGVGAGASFTGVAQSTSDITTGHVALTMSAYNPQYATDTSTPGGFGYSTNGNSGFALTASNVDSSFGARVPVGITNSGTVNIKSLGLRVGDSGTGFPNGSVTAFEKDTNVTIYLEGSAESPSTSVANVSTTLYDLVTNGVQMTKIGVVNPGQTEWLYVTTAPGNINTDVNGTYGNQFSNGTIDLQWTVTGSDA